VAAPERWGHDRIKTVATVPISNPASVAKTTDTRRS
jgi:hypothetical protein